VRYQNRLVFLTLLVCCLPALSKDKKKVILPADVLRAQTVLVVIDPLAGVAIDAPNANNIARNDVENALMNWGRFTLANDVSTADLVICIRKGHGKIAEGTIGGIPNNNRPAILQPTDGGIRTGASQGTPSLPGDPTAPAPANPRPQVEGAQPDDGFAVYRGKRADVLDEAPVWRYRGKDGLESPGVPAVEAFRKLIAEAEKQQAGTP
jgi:hypothetical protein